MNNRYLAAPRTLDNYGIGVKPDADVTCPMCLKNKARIFYNSYPTVRTNQAFPCEKCDTPVDVSRSNYYERNATSIWKDPSGKEVAVDQRGNTFDSPYKNRNFDRHGWTHTNKKKYKRYLQDQGQL